MVVVIGDRGDDSGIYWDKVSLGQTGKWITNIFKLANRPLTKQLGKQNNWNKITSI